MTPLFEIGATPGAALAPLLHVSVPFLAGLGLYRSIFWCDKYTDCLLCDGIELFGSQAAVHLYDLADQLYVFRATAVFILLSK